MSRADTSSGLRPCGDFFISVLFFPAFLLLISSCCVILLFISWPLSCCFMALVALFALWPLQLRLPKIFFWTQPSQPSKIPIKKDDQAVLHYHMYHIEFRGNTITVTTRRACTAKVLFTHHQTFVCYGNTVYIITLYCEERQ